jgi:hypothetical protein
MYSRVFITICCAVFLITLDNGASAQQSGATCKGLSETDCKAKAECFWKASKEKCKEKGEQSNTESAPSADQSPPSEEPPQ